MKNTPPPLWSPSPAALAACAALLAHAEKQAHLSIPQTAARDAAEDHARMCLDSDAADAAVGSARWWQRE